MRGRYDAVAEATVVDVAHADRSADWARVARRGRVSRLTTARGARAYSMQYVRGGIGGNFIRSSPTSSYILHGAYYLKDERQGYRAKGMVKKKHPPIRTMVGDALRVW